MAIDELNYLNDEPLSCNKVTIDDAIPALKVVHKHTKPYTSEKMSGGDLYQFSQEVIDLIVKAMSTDSLQGLTVDELELWNDLVALESQAEGYMPTDAERPELALDQLLMALVNCEDVLTRPNEEDLVDVFPCPVPV